MSVAPYPITPHNKVLLAHFGRAEQHTANIQPELGTAVPGVTDLSDCWSNSSQNRLSLEATKILEKYLWWNYEEALRIWSTLRIDMKAR